MKPRFEDFTKAKELELSDSSQERRDFFRVKIDNPVQFKSYSDSGKSNAKVQIQGSSKDISSAGILFQTNNQPPNLSSILWLNLDFRMLQICKEIENRALIFNDGILGRVVRVEESSEPNAYDIGVCFLTKDQQNSRAVQDVMSEISQNNS